MPMDRDLVFERVKGEVEALASCEIHDPNEELFTSGLLDSVNMLNIIIFIESEFDLAIDPFDVNLDMLGTLDKICDFVLKSSKT
jgi:acyl carrier protein